MYFRYFPGCEEIQKRTTHSFTRTAVSGPLGSIWMYSTYLWWFSWIRPRVDERYVSRVSTASMSRRFCLLILLMLVFWTRLPMQPLLHSSWWTLDDLTWTSSRHCQKNWPQVHPRGCCWLEPYSTKILKTGQAIFAGPRPERLKETKATASSGK